MPLVALEALKARVPVIASKVGGLAEIVRHGENGFLFPMGNEQALTRLMQAFLDKPSLAAEMRERMGPVPSLNDNVRAVEDVYREITSGPGKNTRG
jgi:glycosyltransferase involved in cell wall biosynthesis